MRLYFIRHAQSSNNALFERTGAEQGRSDDPELSELGVRQAKLLAQHILETNSGLEPGGFGLRHLYASPMVRAAHTASEISGLTGLELQIWEDWHETGGIWLDNENGERIGREGKNRAYLEQRFPGVRVPKASARPAGGPVQPNPKHNCKLGPNVFGKNCSSVTAAQRIGWRSSVTAISTCMSWPRFLVSRLDVARRGGRSTTPPSPELTIVKTSLD